MTKFLIKIVFLVIRRRMIQKKKKKTERSEKETRLNLETENKRQKVFVFDRDHTTLLIVELPKRLSQSLEIK